MGRGALEGKGEGGQRAGQGRGGRFHFMSLRKPCLQTRVGGKGKGWEGDMSAE